MPVRSVPGSASVAAPDASGKLFAPSADRNRDPLCDLLVEVAPAAGTALEIASGTGQHIIAYATRLPGLDWQPTEVDPLRRASIEAYAAEAGLPNLLAAVALDATAPGWSAQMPSVDLIVLSNLLHLISTVEARTLINEVALALGPGGRFVLYGPFMRDGELTSPGDQQFDASLRQHDPDLGYKDDFDTIDWLQSAGLDLRHVLEMPANNLAFVTEKPPS